MRQVFIWIGKQWWTLQRFGMTPTKVANRITNRAEPKTVCISIPKSGTHLIERILCLHPKLYRPVLPTLNPSNLVKFGGLQSIVSKWRPGQVLMTHLYHNLEAATIIRKHGIKCLLMIRDPRDIIISTIFYVEKKPKHHLYNALTKQKTFREKMFLLINGCEFEHIPPYNQYLHRFTDWLDEDCFVIRFEDLVGSVGTSNNSVHTIMEIYSYLGMNIDIKQAEKISEEMVSAKSPTFRKGKTQQWKKFFDEETKQLFKNTMGDILIRLGYENNHNW